MFDAEIIEVAIGMIFVFSLLSILVTQINGLVSNLLNLRAKQLKGSIQDLITDKETQAKVLGHPIVNLVKSTVRPEERLSAAAADEITSADENQVTYLSPDTFVDALVGVLKTRSEKSLYGPLIRATSKLPNTDEKSELRELITQLQMRFSEVTIRDIRRVIEGISDDSLRQEVAQSLNRVESTLDLIGYKPPELVALMEGVRRLSDKTFQTAMETVLSTAETMEQAEAQLKEWFNGAMQRARDTYSARIGMYSFVIGLVLAVVLNIDALYLMRTFWENDELRRSTVALANEFERTGSITTESGITIEVPADSSEGEDTGESGEGTVAPAPDDNQEADVEEGADFEQIQQDALDIGRAVQALFELDLPIGWVNKEVTEEVITLAELSGKPDPRDNMRNIRTFTDFDNDNFIGLWVQKIIGILVTAVAAAQGAPFWFDLLNRIAGRKEEKTI